MERSTVSLVHPLRKRKRNRRRRPRQRRKGCARSGRYSSLCDLSGSCVVEKVGVRAVKTVVRREAKDLGWRADEIGDLVGGPCFRGQQKHWVPKPPRPSLKPFDYDPYKLVDGPFSPDVDVSYSSELRVDGASPPSRKAAGVIAPITTQRLDLDKLVSLDREGLLTDILDVIRDERCFLKALRDDASCDLRKPSMSRSTSRHMLEHLPSLVSYGVFREVAPSTPKVILPAFTVTKKSGGLRLVCDGRKLNRIMRPPPKMLLPPLHDVINRFLSSNFVIHCDARSWFYQFPLAPSVQKYFGSRLSAARGEHKTVTLQSMCMGWSWAPAIAQRSAMVLLPPSEGVCWVDNFFCVGNTAEEVQRNYANFLQRCHAVGAELHWDDQGAGKPVSTFDALGIFFDLEEKRYRMSDDWVRKLVSCDELKCVRSGRCTARQWYRVFGCIVWYYFVTNAKLCYLLDAMSFLRRMASKLGYGELGWDVEIQVPPSVLRNVETAIGSIATNAWVSKPSCSRTVTAWSDASFDQWAAVLDIDPPRLSQGLFTDMWAPAHIFIKEVGAALEAIQLCARHCAGSVVQLMVDNLAAVHAIRRGHSSNFAANLLLLNMYETAAQAGLQIEVEWVPTHLQVADKYTRGVVHPAAEQGVYFVPRRRECITSFRNHARTGRFSRVGAQPLQPCRQ
eukprot:TRINITY_DN494_c0_g1_i11.p1 TRINITY_DN494_c0_g1~~TRINITY_DN494_c0_g1_i11.p1  ORF type:complete len:676 (+),score=72.51 TRINITY_DN494_c0_g1_i11:114-2141(+)